MIVGVAHDNHCAPEIVISPSAGPDGTLDVMTDSDLENGDIAETPVPISPIAESFSRVVGRGVWVPIRRRCTVVGGDAEPMLAASVRTIAERCDRVYVVATEESSAYQLLHGTGGPEAVGDRRGTGRRTARRPRAGLAAAAADGSAWGSSVPRTCPHRSGADRRTGSSPPSRRRRR